MTQTDDQTRSGGLLVWITKTTRTGDTNARIGIAEHIGGVFFELDIPTAFCTLAQVRERLCQSHLIAAENGRWPDVVIGPCFHIPYMQMIKTLSGNKTRVVALRPPVRGLTIKANQHDIEKTDIIVSYPYHDNQGIPNLLLCELIANRVTAKQLQAAKRQWSAVFARFSSHAPVIGLLMGGDVGEQRRIFSATIAQELGAMVNTMATQMNSPLIMSVSARTSGEAQEALCSQMTVPYYLYDPKYTPGDNPYFGILATADYIVVTADSISMCCEAVASGKPVYIFYDPDIVEDAHHAMVSCLVKKGYARLLNQTAMLEKFSYTPENSARLIADKVHALLSSG